MFRGRAFRRSNVSSPAPSPEKEKIMFKRARRCWWRDCLLFTAAWTFVDFYDDSSVLAFVSRTLFLCRRKIKQNSEARFLNFLRFLRFTLRRALLFYREQENKKTTLDPRQTSFFSWGTGIRTPTNRFRAGCAAFTLYPNNISRVVILPPFLLASILRVLIFGKKTRFHFSTFPKPPFIAATTAIINILYSKKIK